MGIGLGPVLAARPSDIGLVAMISAIRQDVRRPCTLQTEVEYG
jgi:hypothetical protein